jgi:hypothetical protein
LHDHCKFNVNREEVAQRLSEPLRRYVTSNPASPANAAAGNACNVAGMASLLQAVRNAAANNVVILGAWRTWATFRTGLPC